MTIPNISHPVIIEINGYYFQIFTYSPIVKKQAEQIALTFYKSNKMKKKHKGKVFKILSSI